MSLANAGAGAFGGVSEPVADRKARNIRALLEDIAHGNRVFRSLPDVVSLHTAEMCNLRCIMCERNLAPGRQKLDRDVLRRLCGDLFPTARLAIVAGFHGEPLITDFDVVLDAALRDGVKLDLVTNGTLLTRDVYREAREALNTVNISLDSHIPAVYERIRIGACFEQVHSHLLEIREERDRVPDGVLFSLSAVVMRSNLPHLLGLVRFAADLGMDAVTFQPLRQFGKSTRDEDPMPATNRRLCFDTSGGCPHPLGRGTSLPADMMRFLDEAKTVAREARINLYFGDFCVPPVEVCSLRPKVTMLENRSVLCKNVAGNFAVAPTGDVYPCCHPTDHVLGNVGLDCLGDIWNGKSARRLRRAHFSKRGTLFCTGCVHAPYLGEARPGYLRAAIMRGRLTLQGTRNAVRRRRNRRVEVPTRKT